MRFKDTRFMTAREKEGVLVDWERFLEKGFESAYFTDRLYKHLTMECSFIAHYDRGGFHDYYFGQKRNTGSFIRQFTKGESVEYGGRFWLQGDSADINQAMCDVMKEYAPELERKLERAIEVEDIQIALELLAKHGRRCRIEEDEP
jgi:hypothetical protein